MASKNIRQLIETLALVEGGIDIIYKDSSDVPTTQELCRGIKAHCKNIHQLYPERFFRLSIKEMNTFYKKLAKLDSTLLKGLEQNIIYGTILTSIALRFLEQRIDEIKLCKSGNNLMATLDVLAKKIQVLHKVIEDERFSEYVEIAEQAFEEWNKWQ